MKTQLLHLLFTLSLLGCMSRSIAKPPLFGKPFDSVFIERTHCGQTVPQISELSNLLEKKRPQGNLSSKCLYLFQILKDSINKHGISRVGGCHASTDHPFLLPRNLQICANIDEQTKIEVLQVVPLEKIKSSLERALWNVFYAKISQKNSTSQKKYLNLANKYYENYYAASGSENRDSGFRWVREQLSLKLSGQKILGYVYTETDKYEFSENPDQPLDPETIELVGELLKELGVCIPCFSGQKNFKYSSLSVRERLFRSRSYKRMKAQVLSKNLEDLARLHNQYRKRNGDDFTLRDKLEKKFGDTQRSLEEALKTKIGVKRKFIQLY